MTKWIKILAGGLVFIVLIYEVNLYITHKANSYLVVYGGELNHYKNDFILIVNNQKIDTLNANIPTSFSKGFNFSLGRNVVQLLSSDSKISFEKEIYFYGIFSFNVIEVTSDEFIFSRSFTVPVLE